MKVLKFGGSSVSNPSRIRDVAQIILSSAKKNRTVVVVSAFQGITDQLLNCSRVAETGEPSYERLYKQITKRHRENLSDLFGNRVPKTTRAQIDQLLDELQEVLHGVYLLRHCPSRTLDLIASFGERLSAAIVSAYLSRSHAACFVDARGIIKTDDQFTHAAVLFDQTNDAVRKYLHPLMKQKNSAPIPIVTGFIGSTEDGHTTTIGRNGSDYTAAIVAAALDAELIEIWTDVDGIMSADPSAVPSAFVLPRMSYEEAMELSYFGAKVLHSATIAPAVKKNIPILIKNTFNPSAPGTLVSRNVDKWEGVAKGMRSIDDISLFTLRGMNMVGVPGTAQRLFHTLGNHRVNVILISQASSEHTICFSVTSKDSTATRQAVAQEFHYELQGRLTGLEERPSQTIVAIVGEGMRGTPGVSGRVFNALGRNNINVSAIAQGGSERNISFVIDSSQKVQALNVIHQAFFEKRRPLALIIIGTGHVGSALLKQLNQQRSSLLRQSFDVRVCGIADSKRFLLNSDGLNREHWKEELAKSSHPMDPYRLAQEVIRLGLTNVALVDCTASEEVVKAYSEFVKANMHIITPNKKANVLPWKRYSDLMELMKQRQKYFLYEANVGAGLPVISTLRDLIASGDTIVKIEGILSGTLSYLFNNFDGLRPFSVFVQEAHQRGLTEPDPRDDLSGIDVGRKLLILARELGHKMDLKDIRVENLVPPALRKESSIESFFNKFSKHDAAMQQRLQRARLRGAVLRYVGTLQGDTAFAKLKEVPLTHPFASTKGSDNMIIFTTHRYSHTPLVIQGPGAGADVTAMGVFSDILKLLHYLRY